MPPPTIPLSGPERPYGGEDGEYPLLAPGEYDCGDDGAYDGDEGEYLGDNDEYLGENDG